MRRASLAAFVLLTAAPALAQTTPASSQAPTSATASNPQTVTMTGCIAGGSAAQTYTLMNPIVVPNSAAASSVGTAPAPPGAQPPTVASATPTPPVVPPATPPATSPTVPPTTSPVPPLTAGTAGTATAGTAGTAGTVTPGAAVPGTTAAAGTASAGVNGYRLSGSDLTPWAGQRVEIVGTLMPGNPRGPAAAGASVSLPEFRVQSVRPVTGDCPKQ